MPDGAGKAVDNGTGLLHRMDVPVFVPVLAMVVVMAVAVVHDGVSLSLHTVY